MPLEPKALQQPHPPIWLGVGGPQGLRLTARLGDAWIGAGSSSTEQFLQRAATLREELAAAGRDVASFPVAKRVYLSIGPTVEQARDALKPALDGMYGAPGLTERVAVYGPPDVCLEQLQRIVDGGAAQLVLNTLHDPEGQLDAVTELTGRLRYLGTRGAARRVSGPQGLRATGAIDMTDATSQPPPAVGAAVCHRRADRPGRRPTLRGPRTPPTCGSAARTCTRPAPPSGSASATPPAATSGSGSTRAAGSTATRWSPTSRASTRSG